ncbi:MAG: hypothetical protein ABFS03_12870, partial [Chloroflexota bacterium]
PVMAAGPPLAVEILDIGHDIGGGFGSFTASGPAVDGGLVCPAGDVYDTHTNSSGPPGGTLRILNVDKLFVCDDFSGTFDIQMVVRLDTSTGYTTANWIVTGGTGDYAGLHGKGKLDGTPGAPGFIDDFYYGKMH